jgi:hypothetical protein
MENYHYTNFNDEARDAYHDGDYDLILFRDDERCILNEVIENDLDGVQVDSLTVSPIIELRRYYIEYLSLIFFVVRERDRYSFFFFSDLHVALHNSPLFYDTLGSQFKPKPGFECLKLNTQQLNEFLSQRSVAEGEQIMSWFFKGPLKNTIPITEFRKIAALKTDLDSTFIETLLDSKIEPKIIYFDSHGFIVVKMIYNERFIRYNLYFISEKLRGRLVPLDAHTRHEMSLIAMSAARD